MAKLSIAQSSAPNIIIILADDLGYADVGFNGCKDIPTPHIDRIASNGVVFSRGYVSYAVCGPSRAGIMTGRYQDRFGFSKNPLLAPNDPEMGLPLEQQTIAEFLKEQQYVTGAIGKWHLGAYPTLRPNKRGFDFFFGFLSGGHRYLPEELTLQDLSEAKSQFDGYRTKLLRNEKRVEEKEYLTDAFSREAVHFVEENYKTPFFLYLAYNAPHTPLEATGKYLDRFKQIKDEKRRTYAAMISAMDYGVGLLMDKLQSLGIENNTIVFFLSDNGGPIHANASSNAPLRGEKGDFYEGGIHVPFAVQWKGHLPAGTRYDGPVISLDIFATAAALVSAEPRNTLDGVNLLPYLSGEKKGVPHDDLFWRNFAVEKFAVVGPTYKRIDQKDKAAQLFNLKKDISEKIDISSVVNNQSIMSDLENKIKRWSGLLIPPKFLGLLEDQEYSQQHPERWMVKDNK
ncbi:MAG: sulfatase-like hydrolase/transferase [Terrimonas sp.]|nr:sulfatase-like hydrolase/transferase [Terrimonas sp.]